MSSGDLLIWRNFEVRIFLFFFNWENKSLIGPTKNRWPIKLFFSVLNWFWGAESKQYQIFVLQNSVKLANHRMTYIQHKVRLIALLPIKALEASYSTQKFRSIKTFIALLKSKRIKSFKSVVSLNSFKNIYEWSWTRCFWILNPGIQWHT